MEDRYRKFKKLNWLLDHSFEAERIYYEAGEDVQEVNLKRFMNYQTVNRNRFSNEISELLVHAGIRPKKTWIQKGNYEMTRGQEKKTTTKVGPLKLLRRCTERDRQNLELYNEIIKDQKVPTEVLKVLKKQSLYILKCLEEAEKFRTSQKGLEPERKPKVRKLEAM